MREKETTTKSFHQTQNKKEKKEIVSGMEGLVRRAGLSLKVLRPNFYVATPRDGEEF